VSINRFRIDFISIKIVVTVVNKKYYWYW